MSRIRLLALAIASACIVTTDAGAVTFKTLYAFAASSAGATPYAGLVASGKLLYGTTPQGGTSYDGTVFQVDPSTGATTTIHSFIGSDGTGPVAAVLPWHGVLLGTTQAGGADHEGTVFKLDPIKGILTTLYAFTGGADGAFPSGSLITLGNSVFGTTSAGGASSAGTVFKIDMNTGIMRTLHTFTGGNDGARPYAALTFVGGLLYGTTYSGGASGVGTIFSVDPNSGAEKTRYTFTGPANGANPEGGLVFDGTMLYGAASSSGPGGYGTVFSFDPASDLESTIYSFAGQADGAFPSGNLTMANGLLYGTTESGTPGGTRGGTVFAVDSTTGAETTLYGFPGSDAPGPSGVSPLAGVIAFNGSLYGTAAYGGSGGGGTVFGLDIATASFSVLHAFPDDFSTTNINSSLISAHGRLVGTSSQGDATGYGIVYDYNVASATLQVLHTFTGGSDGVAPQAAVIDLAGTLLGTTTGSNGFGTVFTASLKTGAETPVYQFSNSGYGGNPKAPLIEVGNELYGTTYGGYATFGSIYSLNPSTYAEVSLAGFSNGQNNGALPDGPLLNVNGTLYGTTAGFYNDDDGTIFTYSIASHALGTAHAFSGGDGKTPVGALIQIGALLYGVTEQGGAASNGTVFSFNPQTNAIRTLHSFTGGADGADPRANPIYDHGKLVGTTSAGANGYGSIYTLNVTTGKLQTLYTFRGSDDGGAPGAALLPIGKILYGTTNGAGANGRGTIFSLAP